MIRGHDSGYDSRKCNMHAVINFVYAISGNPPKKNNSQQKKIPLHSEFVTFPDTNPRINMFDTSKRLCSKEAPKNKYPPPQKKKETTWNPQKLPGFCRWFFSFFLFGAPQALAEGRARGVRSSLTTFSTTPRCEIHGRKPWKSAR